MKGVKGIEHQYPPVWGLVLSGDRAPELQAQYSIQGENAHLAEFHMQHLSLES
jgi:hypothetical protein